MSNTFVRSFCKFRTVAVEVIGVACLLLMSEVAYSQSDANSPLTSAPSGEYKQSVANATNHPNYTHVVLTYPPSFTAGHDTNLALIPLIANGRLHRNFLFDTGSTFSAVTDKMAKELGLVTKPLINEEGKPIIIDGKSATSVEIASLKTNDNKLDLHGTFAVINSSMLHALPDFKTVDGIIGVNALSQFGLLWDFAQHTITLLLPANLSSEEVQLLGFSAPGIPLTQAKINQLFYAPLSISSGSATGQEQALVDTGSTLTLISAKLAKQLDLRPDGSIGLIGGTLGNRNILTSPAELLRLGSQSLANLTVHYPIHDDPWPPPQLGVDVLSHFRVLFDFQQGMMYLAPAASEVPNITIKPASYVPNTQP